MVDLIKARFDAVLFDLGNTLIRQENPGVPYESMAVELLPGVEQLLEELHRQVKIGKYTDDYRSRYQEEVSNCWY